LLHDQSITILAPHLGKVAYGTMMEGEKQKSEDTGEETEGRRRRGRNRGERHTIAG
jgi:hypothetical protein